MKRPTEPSVETCPKCDGLGVAPSVTDPVADTARALARLWADAAEVSYTDHGVRNRRVAIEDAARACGPQVYAAFCALVTGDAGRAPEVGR